MNTAKRALVRPSVRREQLLELVATLTPCVIGMEACSGAHHWARAFGALGHTPKLMAPKFVAPYRMAGRRGKNDAADAEAICGVLEKIAAEGGAVGGDSALHAVVGLFQDVEDADCPAFEVLTEEGIPIVIRIVERALEDPEAFDENAALFAMKILALYGTPEGADAIIRAARQPFQPSGYLWSVILGAFTLNHPERERIFAALSDPLPDDFLAIALLDAANSAHLEGTTDTHPFDSAAGIDKLRGWLSDPNEDHFSYATSATAALPFLTLDERDLLLALAIDHASPDVQIEGAWAAAKLGREAGIRWLARCCLDVSMSSRARRYLEELDAAHAIPPEADEPDFQVKSDFAEWLAHPNELGRTPDEVEIVDRRELDWPPERELKPVWLVRYRVADTTGLKDDDVGIGMVGSITFCLFAYKLEERPAEDCYAIHCYWEMASQNLISEMDVEEDSTEYDGVLRQYSAGDVESAKVIAAAECSPELAYPQAVVALAKGTRLGEPGWIVLDGPRSRWYAASEMPGDAWDKTVLMVHMGRVLLGFEEEPNRRTLLKPAGSGERSPEQIVVAFERLLERTGTDPKEAKKILRSYGDLGKAFDDYVAARVKVGGESKEVITSETFEKLLAAATAADPAMSSDMFDCHAPLGESLESYVDALIALGRASEVDALLKKFGPLWDHNFGYGRLGTIAFKAGHPLAEPLLLELRQGYPEWFRSEEMNLLAELWKSQGRGDEAKALLIEALQGLAEQSRSATGTDRKLFEDWFQNRRTAYLRLFPEQGEAQLEKLGIPATTLAKPI